MTGPTTLAVSDGGIFLPPAASTIANEVDYALHFVNVVTAFFFVLIIGLMVFFAIRYRRRDPGQRALSQTSHNTALELAWSIPPIAIVTYMFWIGFSGYMKMTTVPDNAYEVQVSARSWAWQFTHPNGVSDTTLHVPANTPVELILSSQDVLHSLYIPAFRVKQDVVPGRYTNLWFEALEPTEGADFELPTGTELDELARERLVPIVRGELVTEAREAGQPAPSSQDVQAQVDQQFAALDAEEKEELVRDYLTGVAKANGYALMCAEFCGTQHSLMLADVVVHEEGWRPEVDLGPPGPSVAKGERLFQLQACIGCHQIPGGAPVPTCPPFVDGLFGRQEQLVTGETITVDENYVRESILNPQAKVVAGYPPIMPSYAGQLTEEQVTSLIMYLKTLGGENQ